MTYTFPSMLVTTTSIHLHAVFPILPGCAVRQGRAQNASQSAEKCRYSLAYPIWPFATWQWYLEKTALLCSWFLRWYLRNRWFRACLKIGDVSSSEGFWAAGKQFWPRNLGGSQGKIAPSRGQKTRWLDMLTFFKQALIHTGGKYGIIGRKGAEGMKQESFSDMKYNCRKKKTKREEFLEVMEEIIPWEEWVGIIKP